MASPAWSQILTHRGEPLEPPPLSPARGPPTDWDELVQTHFRSGNLSGTDRPLIDRKTTAEAPLTGLSLLIQALVLVRIRQELGTDSRFARALHDFVYALVSVWQ